MIKISFLEDKSTLPLTDEQRDWMAFSATQDDKTLGYCLFTLGPGALTLRELVSEPRDIGLEDGLARTVLDGCRNITNTVRIATGNERLALFAKNTGVFDGDEALISRVLSGCAGH